MLITQRSNEGNQSNSVNPKVQGEADDFSLWDRTMGCQIRSTREIKKGDVIIKIPDRAMITPDLIARSDAGLAIRSCLQVEEGAVSGFWSLLQCTADQIGKNMDNISNQNATQLLVKILQWRKKAETKCANVWKKYDEQQLNDNQNSSDSSPLCGAGSISTRAPILAFLVQQRFVNNDCPCVSSKTNESMVKTFAPYARTLPSFVPLPLTWKRNQLALLASSITGMSILQEVAAHTLLLSNEFCSLVDAGILTKFPSLFPRGSFTWDSWLWACSVYMSRNLPMEMYSDKSMLVDKTSASIWKELGVMVPFLDMLNHEREMNQVTWQAQPQDQDQDNDFPHRKNDNEGYPRAILHKRVKKAAQVYTNYGMKPNNMLIFDYGFAQIGNIDDKLSVGWGLSDCVVKSLNAEYAFECSYNCDSNEIKTWWAGQRLELLTQLALLKHERLSEQLLSGQKLVNDVNRDGVFHPILLTATLIGTMSPQSVEESIALIEKDSNAGIKVTKQHLARLQMYLKRFLVGKLESLLSNLSKGLKVHYKHVDIWTKSSDGGLNYEDSDGSSGYIGWQRFFDSYAYATAIEIEKRYYALGSDSCVLALFDGHLKSLQTSINSINDGKSDSIAGQLTDLGFIFSDEDESISDVEHILGNAKISSEADRVKERDETKSKTNSESPSKIVVEKKKKSDTLSIGTKSHSSVLKLHIGNLPYSSTPSSLFDYFSDIFGDNNVLECHVPTERKSGKSRGFGFVTLPEEVACRALEQERTYKIEGRLVKLARSNAAENKKTSTTNKKTSTENKRSGDNGHVANGRCPRCGFSPKYCDCSGRMSIPRDSYSRSLPPLHPHCGYSSNERSYYEPYRQPPGHFPPEYQPHRRSPSPRYRTIRDNYEYTERRISNGFSSNIQQRSTSPGRERRDYGYTEGSSNQLRRERRSHSRSRSRGRDRRSRKDSPHYERTSIDNGTSRRSKKKEKSDDDKRSISSGDNREQSEKRRRRNGRRRHRSPTNGRRSRSRSATT